MRWIFLFYLRVVWLYIVQHTPLPLCVVNSKRKKRVGLWLLDLLYVNVLHIVFQWREKLFASVTWNYIHVTKQLLVCAILHNRSVLWCSVTFLWSIPVLHFFFKNFIFFLLFCFIPRRTRKHNNRLLSLLYYLNDWYTVVEKKLLFTINCDMSACEIKFKHNSQLL